jgi:membrane dipeptidase
MELRSRSRANASTLDVEHANLGRCDVGAAVWAAHSGGQPAIVGDVEGLDFLEKKLERLEEAHQRGVGHVQLVHYTPNDIGDFRMGAITHQGPIFAGLVHDR